MYDSSTGRTLESFRHVELPTILSEQDGCEDVDLGPPPVSDAVQRAFNGLDLALAAARNAEDLCESRLRVLTWVILFE
ncbi:MAG: hypothetical protein KDK78_09285 [Chlamydiia bacterium]|nr:hypothetical protein [Chlamydiia bacterium]